MNQLDEAERLLNSGDSEGALRLVQGSIEQEGTLRWAELQVSSLLRMRQYDQAARAGKKAIQDGLRSKKLHDLVSESLVHAGLDHRSQDFAKVGTKSPDSLVRQAWAELYRGRLQNAEVLADQACESSPALQPAQGMKYGVQALQGDVDALGRLSDLWEEGHSPTVFNVLIYAHEKLHRLESIERVVQEAWLHTKVDSQFFYWIVRYYRGRGNPLEALAALDKAPAQLSDNARMGMLRGMVLIDLKRYAEALPLLRRAFLEQPSGSDECRYYALVLRLSGHPLASFLTLAHGLRSKLSLLPLAAVPKKDA